VRPSGLQREAAWAGEAQADADHVHVEPVGPMQAEVPADSELAAEAAGGPAHECPAVKARRLAQGQSVQRQAESGRYRPGARVRGQDERRRGRLAEVEVAREVAEGRVP